MRLVIDFTRHDDAGAVEQAAPANLVYALQAEQARNHELIEQLKRAEAALQQGQEALAHQNELLRTRTIERDHAAEDAHLWSLCLAWLVTQESDEELELPAPEVNGMTGQMLTAVVDDEAGSVTIRIQPRPEVSEEGRGG